MDSHVHSRIGRRTFLCVGGFAVAGAAKAWSDASGTQREVTIVEFNDGGVRGGVVRVPAITKTDAEWRAQLSSASYTVARHQGTERPFSSPTLNNHAAGLYRCICCGTALFSSETKFDSKTGWPSFWAPIAKENVVERPDFSLGMARTSVSCARCDAHLGHVFDDGPPPTGLRYCMNDVAMQFVKRT